MGVIIQYYSWYQYIDTATELCDKITKIEQIIAALEDAALRGASTGEFNSYTLDDGQSKITTNYRSITDIERSLQAFEKIRQRYINQLNGRVSQLKDYNATRGYGPYGY